MEVIMDDSWFDALVRRYGTGATRRGALHLLGGGLLVAAGLLPAVSPEAGAGSAKKRCRRKSGLYVAKGTCHCTSSCTSDALHCHHNDPNCYCSQTIGGKGFCGQLGTVAVCTTDEDCPTG